MPRNRLLRTILLAAIAFLRGNPITRCRDGVWTFLAEARLWYFFWLGFRAAVGALLWLGLPVTLLLVERGADLAVRVKLPGDYERPGEIVECTALAYALLFGGPPQRRTVTLLRDRGAIE